MYISFPHQKSTKFFFFTKITSWFYYKTAQMAQNRIRLGLVSDYPTLNVKESLWGEQEK